MKFCKKCAQTKPLSGFSPNKKSADGLDCRCKVCAVEAVRAWRHRNADYSKAQKADHYARNKAVVQAKQKAMRQKLTPEQARKKRRAYYLKNRERILASNLRAVLGLTNPKRIDATTIPENPLNRKLRFDSQLHRVNWTRARAARYLREVYRKKAGNRLIATFRQRIAAVLKGKELKKTNATFDLLGYRKEELVAHMQKQFSKGMTWENFGEWECDHIIPLFAFRVETVADVVRANALTNLQPLWMKENRKKSSKVLHLL